MNICKKIIVVNNCHDINVSPTKRGSRRVAQTPWGAHYITDAGLTFTHIMWFNVTMTHEVDVIIVAILQKKKLRLS